MNENEIKMLKDTELLSCMNNLLYKHQFSEEFLIQTICYYDSWRCLRSQENLSPYFCFRYLYDNKTDSADDWTDYNDIMRYLKKQNIDVNFIENEFNRAMNDRK
jgi:hypothetical protein